MRADMARRVDLPASNPAVIFYPYKSRPGLGSWVAEERASTFVVVSHDGSPQLLEGFRLKELEDDSTTHSAAHGELEATTAEHREAAPHFYCDIQQIGQGTPSLLSCPTSHACELHWHAYQHLLLLNRGDCGHACCLSQCCCSRLAVNAAASEVLPAGPASKALQLSLSVGKINLLVRNLLRTPVLEVEAAKLNLGEQQQAGNCRHIHCDGMHMAGLLA